MRDSDWYVIKYNCGANTPEQKCCTGMAQVFKGLFYFIGVEWTRTPEEVECLAGPFSPQAACEMLKKIELLEKQVEILEETLEVFKINAPHGRADTALAKVEKLKGS